ncbi:MAG: cyclic nucleotide-binding domain-containing protein [Deltaproteobacteria bacterium]|nr:cyclic nucleotide-binding domain-containing protein [Deltaproteobacteria bacterium]
MNLPLCGMAALWGIVAAVSLPLGALVGAYVRPPRKLVSSVTAFGAGALLFALAVELFAGALHTASDEGGVVVEREIVIAVAAGAIAGGLLFQWLNHILNGRGAFLRRGALLRRHVVREQRKRARRLLAGLSRVKILQALPPEEVIRLIPCVETRVLESGSVVFEEGDRGDRLYFVDSGKVDILRRGAGEERVHIATLHAGDVFGEIALLSNDPRTATAIAATRVSLSVLGKEDLNRLLGSSAKLRAAVQGLVGERLRELEGRGAVDPEEARRWERSAASHLDAQLADPTREDIRAEAEGHGRKSEVALAIWLGAILDGVPESLVIGMLAVASAAGGQPMSLAFVAGVFLANFPEAMSSAVTMRSAGMSRARVLTMWGSLCVMGGIAAFAGAALFPGQGHGEPSLWVHAIEGLAGGAMLTMIAETMLPEAFEMGGGPVAGLSTLAGFLSALAVKLVH